MLEDSVEIFAVTFFYSSRYSYWILDSLNSVPYPTCLITSSRGIINTTWEFVLERNLLPWFSPPQSVVVVVLFRVNELSQYARSVHDNDGRRRINLDWATVINRSQPSTNRDLGIFLSVQMCWGPWFMWGSSAISGPNFIESPQPITERGRITAHVGSWLTYWDSLAVQEDKW